jgi:gluconate 2-dehydrogenase gamma chain
VDDATDPADDQDAPREDFDRRALLRGAAAAGASATIAAFWFEGFGNPLRRRSVEPTPAGAPGKTFSAAEWAAMEAALDRLIPSGPGSPGARDVNAVGYLDAVLQEPDLDPANFADIVRGGVPLLEEGARARRAPAFAALAGPAQDEVLRGLETSATGLLWMKRVLYFGIEALLGDPVHGCQPGEVGWKWLGNAPPEPRPHTPGWKPDPR